MVDYSDPVNSTSVVDDADLYPLATGSCQSIFRCWSLSSAFQRERHASFGFFNDLLERPCQLVIDLIRKMTVW
jgi:hypothetical protein